jgi:two-component system sensor histidine kinase PhoQ
MLFSASLILVLFISLTALILDQAFKRGLQLDLQDRLQTQLYLVLGAAEFENEQLFLPQSLNFPKLNQLGSGSIALIVDEQGQFVWRSSSSQNFTKELVTKSLISDAALQAPGQQERGHLIIEGQSFFYTSLGVAWELPSGSLKQYTLAIAEDSIRFEQSISQYRMVLWLGLGVLAVLLLVVFTLTLNWGLLPLKQLALDLNLIETGKSNQLSGHYPKELTAIAENLNQLLQHEKRQHTRYRNTLSNLAHSLKTPLAVLRGLVDRQSFVTSRAEIESAHINTLASQVARMDEIVQHQLQRASHVGPQSVQHTVEVLPLLESLANVVEKVYLETLQCIDIDTETDVIFKGGKGDLMEIIGNLLDNAAKYGGGLIRLALTNELEQPQDKGVERVRCRILVEDNGNGIADDDIADILRRGVRADQKQQGQGIGLAMVVDIVDQYQGRLHLSESSLGGLKVEILI